LTQTKSEEEHPIIGEERLQPFIAKAEATPFLGGSPDLLDTNIEPPPEQSSQDRAVCVSHASGNFIYRRAARFQQMHCSFHPQALKIGQR
jgi:hypothetical protein